MIIALNNKDNLTKEEFLDYQERLSKIEVLDKMILCPTSINIPLFKASDNCYLGAQNVSKFDVGAHTGDISANILKSHGVEYCIVGHSEVRATGETNEDVKEKVLKLFEQGITPIMCIGESFRERQENDYQDVLINEISTVTDDLSEEQKEKIIIAYEPIWSIGTGIVPKNYEIEEVVKLIKDILPNNKILYGGSVNENNIDTLKSIQGIEGYLLGGVSLEPDKLSILIEKLIEK